MRPIPYLVVYSRISHVVISGSSRDPRVPEILSPRSQQTIDYGRLISTKSTKVLDTTDGAR